MGTYQATREQLAMVSVLMSRQASRHPLAMTKRPHSLEEVSANRTLCYTYDLLHAGVERKKLLLLGKPILSILGSFIT